MGEAQQGANHNTATEDQSPELTDEQLKNAGKAAMSAQEVVKDEDIDALLDEIDAALETNAQEVVEGFVQKGGQ